MNPFKSNKKLTRKSCLTNGVVTLLCAVLVTMSSVLGAPEAKEIKNLVIAAGLLYVVSGYWVWKYLKFKETGSDDSGNN